MEHGALPWHWHGSSIYQEKREPTLAHLWFQTLLRSSVKTNNLILILVSTLRGQLWSLIRNKLNMQHCHRFECHFYVLFISQIWTKVCHLHIFKQSQLDIT